MTTTAFDASLRTLECSQCGAPIAASLRGGQARCGYCGAVNVVVSRVADFAPKAAPSLAEDVARLSRLKAQLESPISGHAYDMARPPLGWEAAEIITPAGFERQKREWSAVKHAAAHATSAEDQRKICWLAMGLEDAYVRAGNPMQSRAVLETSLDLLRDPGHRHLVRCRLASEAVREGDAAAAEGWLAECDPAPEVLELDSAYREALARTRAAARDHGHVLTLVGTTGGDVPIHPAHRSACALLRVHALEQAGQLPRAAGELDKLCVADGEDVVLAALARERLAPRALADRREKQRAAKRAQIGELLTLHALQPAGLRALGPALAALPVLSLVLLLAATIPRCFFDADPFFGAHGHVLCPPACAGCQGPLRVYTHWQHNGGEHSTNGPEYYCSTRALRIDRMSDAELESRRHTLGRYELSWAPAAATYVTFLLGLIPFAPLGALSIHRRAKRTRADLEQQAQEIAASLGEPLAPIEPRRGYRGLMRAVAFVAVAALIAIAIAALEVLL